MDNLKIFVLKNRCLYGQEGVFEKPKIFIGLAIVHIKLFMECNLLMIVVAIIGILAAIAVPAYQDYTRKAGDKACLGEAKGVASKALIHFSEQTAMSAPVWKACDSAVTTGTIPVEGTPNAAPSFTIKAKAPGTGIVTCGPTSSCSLP